MESKIKLIDGSYGTLKVSDNFKAFKSKYYNYLFYKKDGQFFRWGNGDNKELPKKLDPKSLELYNIWVTLWGKDNCEDFKTFLRNLEDDGDEKYWLPEILDMEVATKCSGPVLADGKPRPCPFCYKSNNPNGSYTDTELFKKVIDNMPSTLTQCALGIGDITQPNLWELMQYLRNSDIVPNVTINGALMTDEYFDKLKEHCGAVAISFYDKDLTFNSVHELATIRNMSQINIHYMICEETYDRALQLIDEVKTDERLKNLNAVVFLSLKKKGRAKGDGFTQLSQEKFKTLSSKAMDAGIGFGYDSCSAQKALQSFSHLPNYKQIEQSIEPCESSVASSYINSEGYYFPCSFSEGEGDWEEGINVAEVDDFLKDIWFSGKTKTFKDKVIECRHCSKSCPLFEI